MSPARECFPQKQSGSARDARSHFLRSGEQNAVVVQGLARPRLEAGEEIVHGEPLPLFPADVQHDAAVDIIRVRLPISRAFFMLWVIIRQVMPAPSTISRVSWSTFSAVPGSRAAVCSSKSSSLGGTMVAISRVRAWRCPPERSPTGWRIRSSRPMSSLASWSRKKSLSFFPTRLKKALWCVAVRR